MVNTVSIRVLVFDIFCLVFGEAAAGGQAAGQPAGRPKPPRADPGESTVIKLIMLITAIIVIIVVVVVVVLLLLLVPIR